jgi:hypothetical protein
MWLRITVFHFIFSCTNLASALDSNCRVSGADSQTEFLNLILQVSSNSTLAIGKTKQACSEIDLFGKNTGEFGRLQPLSFPDQVVGGVQAFGISGSRAILMSQEAESNKKLQEMRRTHPQFLASLDRCKLQNEVLLRLKCAYEFITSRTRYDEQIPRNPLRLFSSDPIVSAGRVLQGQPISVCTHYASLLNFALNYVGGGPNTQNFDVGVNAGNIHAWNFISYNQNGRRVQFDLDATHFSTFVPLSTSHWDQTIVGLGTREKIINACRLMLSCLTKTSQSTKASRSTGTGLRLYRAVESPPVTATGTN